MAQWRNQQPLAPPMPRLNSAMSALSTNSDASFGMGMPRSARQASQTHSRLGRADEEEEEEVLGRYGSVSARGMARAPSHGITPSIPYPHPPTLRNRSASSPNVYQVPAVAHAPPLPSSGWTDTPQTYSPLPSSSSASLIGGTAYFNKRMSGSKRSSSESHSTETSETSSQSPATPYGMIPDDPRSRTPVSRQNSQDIGVRLKVQYGGVSLVLVCPAQ
jgi:cell division control protein 24